MGQKTFSSKAGQLKFPLGSSDFYSNPVGRSHFTGLSPPLKKPIQPWGGCHTCWAVSSLPGPGAQASPGRGRAGTGCPSRRKAAGTGRCPDSGTREGLAGRPWAGRPAGLPSTQAWVGPLGPCTPSSRGTEGRKSAQASGPPHSAHRAHRACSRSAVFLVPNL